MGPPRSNDIRRAPEKTSPIGEPAVVHLSAGRLRAHRPGWSGFGRHHFETQIRRAQGVRAVEANPWTGNVLIVFDPTLEVGRVEGLLSKQVVGAVASSAVLLVGAVTFPPVRNLIGLQTPSAFGWGVIAASSGSAVLISRAISALSALRVATPDGHLPESYQRAAELLALPAPAPAS